MEFWELSLSEISEYIHAVTKRDKEEFRMKCSLDYTLAKAISYAVNAPQSFPNKEELYPVFSEGEEDWRSVKAYVSAYAQAKNKEG